MTVRYTVGPILLSYDVTRAHGALSSDNICLIVRKSATDPVYEEAHYIFLRKTCTFEAFWKITQGHSFPQSFPVRY